MPKKFSKITAWFSLSSIFSFSSVLKEGVLRLLSMRSSNHFILKGLRMYLYSAPIDWQ